MPTFKLALKLICKNWGSILINVIAFTFIALLFGSFYQGGNKEIVKTNIAIINYDGDSPIIETFSNSLDDIADIKEIKTDTKSMQDALFYRKVDYILVFPAGYTESFFKENKLNPEKITLPDSFAGIQIDNRLTLFTNTANIYYNNEINQYDSYSNLEKAVLEKTSNDLSQKVSIELLNTFQTRNLYRFSIYCMFGLMTLLSLIGNILVIPMFKIKREKIVQRNLCAPVSSKSINLQILLAVGILFILSIIFYLSIAAIFFGNVVFTAQGLWMCLNIIILGFCYLGIIFLTAVLIKSDMALNFVATALSLTFCFSGGAFVPSQYFSKGFTLFGKMLPSWWFVKNIEMSYANLSLSGAQLGTMFGNMAIVLAFGIAALMVGLVIQKYKSIKRN